MLAQAAAQLPAGAIKGVDLYFYGAAVSRSFASRAVSAAGGRFHYEAHWADLVPQFIGREGFARPWNLAASAAAAPLLATPWSAHTCCYGP